MEQDVDKKRKTEGGKIAQRGFIFQSVIAMIECLERNDWDVIDLEPETQDDKVDIILSKNGRVLSAIQVKSSKNQFERWAVSKWLDELKIGAGNAEEICLYLVGDKFSAACEEFITNNSEIKTTSFQDLPRRCTEAIVSYVKNTGLVGDVRQDDLRKLDNEIFAEIHRNNISPGPLSRNDFQESFRRAMPVHFIPLCLTPIPVTNQEVGLVGRDKVKDTVRTMLEENRLAALVNGIGGIGKTAVMQHICIDLKNEGKYVAWIDCGDSLRNDLLMLRSALGIPESDGSDTAYGKVLDELRSRLSGKMYLFLDNLSRILSKEERDMLLSLGIHVMVTSRMEHNYFPCYTLGVLPREAALDMFYGYYKSDIDRRFERAAWDIIDSIHSHTLLVELLAKAAWKKGGTLEVFRDNLEQKGFFDVFKESIWTDHDADNRTIVESVKRLYEMSDLSREQQRIMELFSIFTPEKEVYYKVIEWADLDKDSVNELVDLGWIERGGLESGYRIHQIVRDSLTKQMETSDERLRLEEYGMLLGNVLHTYGYLGSDTTYDLIRERIVTTECIADFLWKSAKGYADNFKPSHRYNKFRDFLWKKKPPFSMNIEDFGKMHLEQGGFVFSGLLLKKVAHYYIIIGDYRKAEGYARKALDIQIEMFGYNFDTLDMIHNLATAYYRQMKYHQAIMYGKMNYSLCKRYSGYSDECKAATCSLLGSAYIDMGDFNRAKKYIEESISINKKMYGECHSSIATGYHNMGRLYIELGDSEKALECYKESIRIHNVTDGNSISAAATIHAMGKLYLSKGDYKQAEKELLNAQSVFEKYVGDKHFYFGAVCVSLGELYLFQRNNEKACEYYGKALQIYEKMFENSHPCMLDVLSGLSHSMFQLERYKEAAELYERACAAYGKGYKGNNPEPLDVAKKYSEIAEDFLRNRQYAISLDFYKKSLGIIVQIFGESNPGVIEMINFVDNMDNALRMGEEGITLLDEVLEKWKASEA